MAPLELKDLRSLVAVYEQRHFGRAADQLRLSQPAVSKSIKRLEGDLGGILFDRARARVVPTQLCEEVVARVKPILAGLKDLDQAVAMLRGLQTGSLSVGVGPAMSESFVATATAELAEAHRRIQIDVRVDHWRQLSCWLDAGEIELMVADLTDVENDTRFHITPLPPAEFVWFCRAEHPLAGRTRLSRAELLDYPLATPRMPPWGEAWFREVLANPSASHSQAAATPTSRQPEMLPTIRCESYSMLKRIVLQSNCISAALLDTIREEWQQGQLHLLPVHAATLTTKAGIVRLANRTPSPLGQAFERILLEHTSRIEAGG